MYLSPNLAHSKFDSDQDGLLDEREFQQYFDHDYMDIFRGIDIDPKFIDGTINFFKAHDTDKNGLSVEELQKAALPNENQLGDREPHHYPEQEL